ncbi:hypothetical protein [Clostridium ganghwense]|uniref:Uncharacterized protein n=1 Tax=Clostridium ganghwense TaxID=312089 RepID=A0ABT4CT70_9CLOT|nr:hypothetical protein [Clostridium ganghwense]MCY6371396.1 hypothetical protein [Clostridium ganghwense]
MDINKPDISNLPKCIDDVKNAALDNDQGPNDPTNYKQLLIRLDASRYALPPLYRKAVFNPYIKKLENMGPENFNKILLLDPKKQGLAGLMLDIAHAILQNGEGYHKKATDAFQEVVSDLTDGFLSAEDRRNVKPPDKSVLAPLVKWGNPSYGPYTWTIDSTSIFGLQAAIVSLPPANARHGLLAWAALAHETVGHDILHADTGLIPELKNAVLNALKEQELGNNLAEYWASRIDETASDVLGILNMGPASGIGLIGYFRGLNYAFTGKPILRNVGPQNDPHPADILRGYLAASAVRLLKFKGAEAWAKILEDETNKDLSTIRLAGTVTSVTDARKSAKIVASTIMYTNLNSLENHQLGEIQNWYDEDEYIVNQLRSHINTSTPLSIAYASGIYAAHVVAAAVTEALSKGTNIYFIFQRMLSILKIMHDANQSWGPLYIAHPGDITAHKVYLKIKDC